MVSPDGKGRVWLSTEPSSPITMKTKNSSHSHRPLALLGIPFLLLIPARMPDQPGEPDAPAKGKGRDEAEALINEILGSESRISRAEVAREERFRPRFERQCPGQEQLPEASPDQRRAATTYLQERLRGREVKGPPPEFFLRNGRGGDRRNPRFEESVVEQIQFTRPRYLNEWRRYVHFDSRAAIPAILMAAQAMNQVRFQPTREIAPMLHERQEVSA